MSEAASTTAAAAASSGDVQFRALAESDYHKGYLQLLSQLTVVGDVTEQQFKDQLARCRAGGSHIVVGELDGRVVAAATLLVEAKFVHACGFVGHIEDVVVDKTLRGKNLGARVIAEAVKVAAALPNGPCYKVILDCAEHNVGFYEKCGFTRKEVQMRIDIPPPQQQQKKEQSNL